MTIEDRTLEYREAKITSFGGGITDRYIASDLSKYKIADNLVISNVGPEITPTLKIRPGFKGYARDIWDNSSAAFTTIDNHPYVYCSKDDTIIVTGNRVCVVEDEISLTFNPKTDIETAGTYEGQIDFGANGALSLVKNGTITLQNNGCYLKGNILPTNSGSEAVEERHIYKLVVTSNRYVKLQNITTSANLDLQVTTTNTLVTLVKKAVLKEVTYENAAAIGLEYMGDNVLPSFSKKQDQVMIVTRGADGASGEYSRPVRVYRAYTDATTSSFILEGMGVPRPRKYGSTPILWKGDSVAGAHTATFDIYNFEAPAETESDPTYQYAVVFSRTHNVVINGSKVEFLTYGTPQYSDSVQMNNATGVAHCIDEVEAHTTQALCAAAHADKWAITDATVIIKIPSLPNATNDVYDYWQMPLDDGFNGTFKCELYRTVNGGTSFFLVDTVTIGDDGGPVWVNSSDATVTVWTDTTIDTTLRNNKGLYTNPDNTVLEHWNPPKCKYMTTVGDLTYYGNVIEESINKDTGVKTEGEKPYRVYQSIPGTQGQVGASNFTDVDDEIVGLGQVGSIPVIFTKTYVYRLAGAIDGKGIGAVRAKALSEIIGCRSHNSIISTTSGVFWMGNEGFYHTDGHAISELTTDLKESFNKLTDTNLVWGAYDEKNRIVYWSVCDQGTAVNNRIWAFSVDTKGFTTFSSNLGAIKAASLSYKNGSMFRGDISSTGVGFIFEHRDEYKQDVAIDITVDQFPHWKNRYIDFNFLSAATDFGSAGVRKWVRDATITIKSQTNIGVLPYSNNDDSARVRDMKQIRHLGTLAWGSGTFVWGTPELQWRIPETVSNVRRFPRGTMRCRRKQVGLRSARVPLLKTDDYTGLGNPNINVVQNPSNALSFTLQLDPAGIIEWPGEEYLDDSVFYFQSNGESYDPDNTENYTHGLSFLSRTDDYNITVEGSNLTDLARDIEFAILYDRKWVMEAYPTNQEIEITGINIRYANIPNVEGRYQREEEGSNE